MRGLWWYLGRTLLVSAHDDLWAHPRLNAFTPKNILHPRSRRREKAPLEDYNHIRVAEIAKQVVEQGGLAQTGGHGQLVGIDTHWELWSLVQGGMSNLDALRCGTILGARYLGLDKDLGRSKKASWPISSSSIAGTIPPKTFATPKRSPW